MKTSIRRKLIQQRKDLSIQEVKQFSFKICQLITAHKCFSESNTIALYHSFANEVDLLPLMHIHKELYLPVIKENKQMEFKRYTYGVKLKSNKYGILEPSKSQTIRPQNIDLCLMPLVGFNRQGHRLGMGAGYYDRYFALNNVNKKPTILAGVAYEFQECNEIQSDHWDIPLNYIFTNKEVIEI